MIISSIYLFGNNNKILNSLQFMKMKTDILMNFSLGYFICFLFNLIKESLYIYDIFFRFEAAKL